MNIKELVVYLSGAISGRNDVDAARHFASVETLLERAGKIVFNPMYTEPKESWEEYMREGLAAIVDSDCVLMLSGWEKSRGAAFERIVAFELGIPIYYEKDM